MLGSDTPGPNRGVAHRYGIVDTHLLVGLGWVMSDKVVGEEMVVRHKIRSRWQRHDQARQRALHGGPTVEAGGS